LYELRYTKDGLIPGETYKHGETVDPFKRYTDSFYQTEKVEMIILDKGTKAAIHDAQQKLNILFWEEKGAFPNGVKSKNGM
jgi:hypothetical protein